VIPVLFLVIGVELRAFTRPRTREDARFAYWTGSAFFVFVASAETFALLSLAFGDTMPLWVKWWVLIAIVLQLFMVGLIAVPRRSGFVWEGFVDPQVLREVEERERREQHRKKPEK
jgi:hypothetical protein